jgi:hypothetical protein
MSHDDDHSRPAGIGLAFAGIGVSIFAIIDNRRQRTQREKAVIAAHATFEHVYELPIGIKPVVATVRVPAIDDGLSAISEDHKKLNAL